jgi:hypothetical protein
MGVLLQESGIFTQSAHKTKEVAQNIKHKTRLTNADPDLNPAFWVNADPDPDPGF